MVFALSKIFWTLANPGNLILIGLLIGFMVHLAPWRRVRHFGRGILGLTIGTAIAVAVLPVGTWLLSPLEDRFPAVVEPPSRVDGIIVLGGAIDLPRSVDRPGVALNGDAERIIEFVGLAKRFPNAKLVFSGGSGFLLDQVHREADFAAPLLQSLGVDPGRVLFDRDARNTYESAGNALKLADPQPGEVWLLVTSAYHMPRSVGVFRRAGWSVIAYPVDYLTGPSDRFDFDFAAGLGLTSRAIKEWIGLLAYWEFGWTDALFPGPTVPLEQAARPAG